MWKDLADVLNGLSGLTEQSRPDASYWRSSHPKPIARLATQHRSLATLACASIVVPD